MTVCTYCYINNDVYLILRILLYGIFLEKKFVLISDFSAGHRVGLILIVWTVCTIFLFVSFLLLK